MSAPTLTRLYDGLTVKLGKETAEDLANYIDHKIMTTVETKFQNLSTKDDLLKLEIRLTDKLNQKFYRPDEKLNEWKYKSFDKSDMAFDRLMDKMDKSTNNVIEGMFILWVSQIAIFGLVLLICKKIN
jgi:hypothetical protein